jgi:selenocysteine-specific elongation factor
VQVIATAGHVDHGKSALVRALTGMEPDRWAEERRRGMTIDLGFAWMSLPGGERLAFVDVPGHERFVPNMLAGVGPVPAVLFVVAADGGWMPQSQEHLAAIDAVGIRHGLLAVTRSDLADPGPAARQALDRIAATSLGPVEAVAVSAVTGAGMGDLRAALARLMASLPAPDPRAAVRLWVDRSFTIRGSGTVVTGTLPAGTVSTGQELLLTPSMRPVRIRGIQALNEPASSVSGVARVALNLRGVAADVPARGMALVDAASWKPTRLIDARLCLAAQLRLPPEMTLHIGSARTVARIRPLGPAVGTGVPPGGGTGVPPGGGLLIARLTLRDMLPLHVGDRILLRDPGSAEVTIMGATVLDVAPPALARRGAAAAAGRELAAWPEVPAAADLLRRHRLLRASVLRAMGVPGGPPPVAGEWLADPAAWAMLRRQLADVVAAHARRDPLAIGMPPEAARAALRLPDRSLVEALARLPAADETQPPIRLADGYLRLMAEEEQPPGQASQSPRPEQTRESQPGGEQPSAPQPPEPSAPRPPEPSAPRPPEPSAPRPPEPSAPRPPEPSAPRPSEPSAPRPSEPSAPRPSEPSTLRPPPPSLPAYIVAGVRAVLTDLAAAPFLAPEAGRLRELGLDARAIAAAARAGLLLRVSEQIVLAPDAEARAARVLAGLPQPFTTAEARLALGTTRRVAIPLLEHLDRARITQRLPDDRRRLR